MKSWDEAFSGQLLEAKNYRDFIRLFFQRDPAIIHPKKLTFGEFAYRSNFASKAYISDIIAGRKRMTPGSFDKVALGLRLNSSWSKYLKCLVACEEPKFHSAGKDTKFFDHQRKKIKETLLKSRSTRQINDQPKEFRRMFLQNNFSEIYASLGELNVGETLEGLIRKTRLPLAKLKTGLTDLESIGLLRLDPQSNRYIPLSMGVEAYGLKNESDFKEYFFRSLSKVRSRFAKQASSENSLFMTQAFSVKASELPELRKQLAELIDSFASQAEDCNGDSVAELCIGFTNNC